MNRLEATRRRIHDLLRRQRLGVLSTSGESGPYASLVAFAASDDDRHLYFATARTTRKFTNITGTPRVALLVNDSLNHPDDFHRAAAVTALGGVAIVAAERRAPLSRDYLARHPHLEEFLQAPSCELIEIAVERYILVERFQNVTEYRIDHDLASPAG